MKFCVIGLGRLGYTVATRLAENGMEVMAIDQNETIISTIKDYVTQAICIQIRDEISLKSIGIEEIDTAIVATGENFAESILMTALLKKAAVPKVIARAVNDIHKDILSVLGAERIILPEKEVGTVLADTLSSPFLDTSRLTENFSISLVVAPKKLIGSMLKDINFINEYNVNFIGIKEDGANIARNLDHIIKENDKLIFAGENKYLEKIAKQ